jgi:hypothetical protein
MKQTYHLHTIVFIAAALALGCDAAPSNEAPRSDAAAPAPASPGKALTYDDVTALLAEEDDFAKARKLGELLPTLGPESLPAIKKALDDAALLEMSAIEFELFMRYWTQHEPAEASYYALGTAPRAFRVSAIYGAVIPWVKADPEKAIQTLRPYMTLPGDDGAAAQIALVRGWYASGRPGLEEFIHGIGAGFERQRALGAYATCIIRDRGVDAVVAWAEAIPDTDPSYKVEAFRRVGTALVPHDGQAARRFCEKHCEGEFGSNLRVRIADRWARDDAEAALTWLAGAPESQDTSLATRISFANWCAKDRPACLAWMKTQLESHAKEPLHWIEPAMPIYARWLAKDSPTAGLEVASKFKDPHERNVVMVELAHEWYHKGDKVAAEAWLEKSPLNEALRAMVRSPERPAIYGGEGETKAAPSDQG